MIFVQICNEDKKLITPFKLHPKNKNYVLQVFFEHDINAIAYEIECLETGYFQEPDEWPRCIGSKLFFE